MSNNYWYSIILSESRQVTSILHLEFKDLCAKYFNQSGFMCIDRPIQTLQEKQMTVDRMEYAHILNACSPEGTYPGQCNLSQSWNTSFASSPAINRCMQPLSGFSCEMGREKNVGVFWSWGLFKTVISRW